MDKEIYSPSEFSSEEEFQSFMAEQYNVKEHIKNNMESFKVGEIQDSSLDNFNNIDEDKSKNIKDDINKIKDLSQSVGGASSGATGSVAASGASVASAGVSVGAAASLVVTAVAGTSIVLGNNILENEPSSKPSEEPPPIVLPVFGEISYLNSMVQYYEDEPTMTYKQNITFYLDSELNEGYRVEIIDPNTNKGVLMTNNKVELNGIDENINSFQLNCLNRNDEVVHEEKISVNNHRLNPYDYEINVPYFTTVNPDSTYNIYMEFCSSYQGEFYNYLQLYDTETYQQVDADIEVYEGYSIARNIRKGNVYLHANPYVLIDNNKYSFGDNKEGRYVGIDEVRYSAFVEDDILTFQLDDDFIDPIKLDVTYDDNEISHHEIKRSDMDEVGQVQLHLNKISSKIHIDFHIDRVLPNTIYDYQFKQDLMDKVTGQNHEIVEFSTDIDTRITDKLNLSHVIMPSLSYVNLSPHTSTKAPIMLYFDGYLNPGRCKYGVDVKDANGVTLNEHVDELFDDFSRPIIFKETEQNMTYTFSYYLKDVYGKHVINEVRYNPSEKPADLGYGDGSMGVYPSGCYVTYNDDNTYNVYSYVELYNPDEEEMVYLLDFVDANDPSKIIKSYLGNKTAILEDVPLDTRLYVQAEILIKRGNTYYSATQAYMEKTPIGVFLDGRECIELSDGQIAYDAAKNEFKINYSNTIFEGDLNIAYQIDGGLEQNIIINHQDITTDELTGDTSCFKFFINLPDPLPNEITFKVTGLYHVNEPQNEDTYLALPVTYKGSNTLPFISNFKYPNDSVM